MLGIVVERASGLRFAEAMSDLLWAPLGAGYDAEITVDRHGNPMTDGGLSMTLRDLAASASSTCRAAAGTATRSCRPPGSTTPATPTTSAGAPSPPRTTPGAWASATRPQTECFTKAHYRNCWWVLDPELGVLLASGIYGQTVYVNMFANAVIVMLCSQPAPFDGAHNDDVLKPAPRSRRRSRCSPGTARRDDVPGVLAGGRLPSRLSLLDEARQCAQAGTRQAEGAFAAGATTARLEDEMRAAGIRTTGGDVEALDLPAPRKPAADEVLLRVRAAGVGVWEDYVRTGGWDIGRRPAMALGVEAAGVVVAVGRQVGRLSPGDWALTYPLQLRDPGSWAELLLTPAALTVAKPPSCPGPRRRRCPCRASPPSRPSRRR